MPTYEYVCENGHRVEVFKAVSDAPPSTCQVCGAPLRKVFHPAGILFKGSGFYSTDKRSKRAASSSGDGQDAKGGKEGKERKEGKASKPEPAGTKGSRPASGDRKGGSSGGDKAPSRETSG